MRWRGEDEEEVKERKKEKMGEEGKGKRGEEKG